MLWLVLLSATKKQNWNVQACVNFRVSKWVYSKRILCHFHLFKRFSDQDNESLYMYVFFSCWSRCVKVELAAFPSRTNRIWVVQVQSRCSSRTNAWQSGEITVRTFLISTVRSAGDELQRMAAHYTLKIHFKCRRTPICSDAKWVWWMEVKK